MKLSSFCCSRCGSRRVRRSQRNSFAEHLRTLLGQYPIRCDECGARSLVDILMPSKLLVAKCPLCLEMHLSTWDVTHYRIPSWKRLLLKLGASRYRCNACRYNFVSFKRSEPTVSS